MDVVILAGGKGTRLAELTRETPKGLAPIGDRPILWHIIRHFAVHGCERAILCVGYEGGQIADYFAERENRPSGCRDVLISDAGVEATKSERLRAALEQVSGDRFMLAYGDDLSDVDVREVDALGRRSGSIVTLTAVRPRSPFGRLILEDEKVVGFDEKSEMDEWINAGFMSVDRSIQAYLEHGELEREVFAALVAEGKLTAHHHRGYWRAMNTHKDYLELNELTARGEMPWVVPGDEQ